MFHRDLFVNELAQATQAKAAQARKTTDHADLFSGQMSMMFDAMDDTMNALQEFEAVKKANTTH